MLLKDIVERFFLETVSIVYELIRVYHTEIVEVNLEKLITLRRLSKELESATKSEIIALQAQPAIFQGRRGFGNNGTSINRSSVT